jgi:hypothetical protein
MLEIKQHSSVENAPFAFFDMCKRNFEVQKKKQKIQNYEIGKDLKEVKINKKVGQINDAVVYTCCVLTFTDHKTVSNEDVE